VRSWDEAALAGLAETLVFALVSFYYREAEELSCTRM
jgi:hypothetical protein